MFTTMKGRNNAEKERKFISRHSCRLILFHII